MIQNISEILHCDPEKGVFIWKIPAKRRKVGEIAGALRKDGYVHIQIEYVLHLAHRLMWEYNFGKIPDGFVIDHINRQRNDNRLCNLRLTTNKENAENLALLRKTPSGFRGVSFDATRGKWIAQLKTGGKNFYFGRFDNVEDAVSEAIRRRNEYFTHNEDDKNV